MRLKSALVTATIALLLAQSGAHAQLKESYGMKLGVVGANQTWNDYGTVWKTDNRWGFTADAFIEVPFFRYFSAQAEIQYTQKGMSYSQPMTVISQSPLPVQSRTFSPRIDYISIPLLAKVKFPFSTVTPYILVGPRFDFLVYADPDGLGPVVNNFDNMDYGLTVGAGIEFDSVLPFGLLAEFRYNPNSYDSYDSGQLSVRNRTVDFLVGVRL